MLQRLNRFLFRNIRKVPVLKDIVLCVNAYAWAGDSKFVTQFASIGNYFHRIFSKMIICAALTWGAVAAAKYTEFEWCQVDVPSLNLGMFPNLLGFGIGVYALIFIFPKDLLSKLDRNQKEGSRRIGAQGLNTAVAYPLAVFSVILLSSLFLRFIKPNQITVTVGIFLGFYGLVICLELVTFMLMAAKRLIVNSVKLENQDDGV